MREACRWEALRPEEFYAELERVPIAWWACGAMEEHGLQNPLGTDPLSAHELALRAAAIAGGIVHPPIFLAQPYFPGLSREELRAGRHELFPPSLWVSRECCERVYTELLESLADMGFKVCLAISGHAPAERLLSDIETAHAGRIGGMRFWGGGLLRILATALPEDLAASPGWFGHGMKWETALNLVTQPDRVDLSRVDAIKSGPLVSQLQPQADELLAEVKEADAAFGERYFARGGELLAEIARELLAEHDGGE